MILSVEAKSVPSDYALVDATWVLPGRTDPLDSLLKSTKHKIDTQAIKALPPHERPLRSASIFGQAGISGLAPLAVYDRAGLFSAPWVWWLLRSHGCNAVLLEGWAEQEENLPLLSPTEFKSSADPHTYNASKQDVLSALDSQVQVIDARPAARFSGDAPEPRSECRSGHIPNSLNVPFPTLKSGRYFQDQAALQTVFDDKGIDLSRPIITTCGSGVTASGLAFALTRCGAEDVRVYQGSWAEWGVDTALPIETGA